MRPFTPTATPRFAQLHLEVTHHGADQGVALQHRRIAHHQAPLHRQLTALQGDDIGLEIPLVLARRWPWRRPAARGLAAFGRIAADALPL